MAVAMIGPKFYAWDRDGKPLAFGKLFTYQARTNIPKPTYQSEDQVTENTNPVILNGEGYANIYLDGSYKMVLKDKDDNEIWSSDPVTAQVATEWINCRTASYVQVDRFSIPGEATAEYDPGRSVRMSDGSGYSYGTIVSSYYASGSTYVVIDANVPVGLIGVCASIIGINSTGFIDQINQNTKDITKNQQDIATNAANIQNNASDISAVETKNTQQDSLIESNEVRITNNESAISALESGQNSGVLGYETKALLDADLVPEDQTIAYVTNDPTATNNGTYRKDGASGAGSWVQASTDLASQAYQLATENDAELDSRFYERGRINGWYSPFFRLAVQDDDQFLGRSRFDQATNYTVLPSQFFDGQRLQFETAVTLPKCKVYTDEMGTTNGDTITIRALVTGNGDIRIYARNYLASGSPAGGEQPSGLFTVTPQGTILTLEATIDPDTLETRIYMDGAQAIYQLESLWVVKGTQAYSPLAPTLDSNESLERDVATNKATIDNSLVPRVDYAIEDYEKVSGDTESVNLAVTNPQVDTQYGTEFTGWGERLTPAGVSFNALRARFIGRNTSTIVDSAKWRNIKCVVRTAATNSHLATSTLLAVGSVQVLEEDDVLQDVTILLRDPVTNALKTLSNADLDAEYFVGFYYTNRENKKAFGSGARADLSNSLGESYYTTQEDAAVLVTNWSDDSADRGFGFDHVLITNPVQETVYAPTPQFKNDILEGAGALSGVPYFGENNLKNYLAKWSKLVATSDQMVVGIFGDSWVNTPHRIYKPIRDWFAQEYGISCDGYVSANLEVTVPDGSVTRGRSGTWTQIRTDSSAIGPDSAQASTVDINASATFNSNTATSYVVHYLQRSGGGSFDLSVGGGPTTSVDTNGSESYQTVTIAGSGQLLIDITAIASLGVVIGGVECRNDTNGEVLFHKLGSGGARASTFANQDAVLATAAYTALDLDVAMILVGTNDNYGDVVPSVFKSELETIIGRLKAANPLIDIVLIGAGDNADSHAYTIQEYNAEMYNLAVENDYATISLYEFLGPYADANLRGLYSDTVHPSVDGGQVIGRVVINRLLKV